ncbi:hypothetical protein [Anaeromyxobacter paludicola]|uniref:Glycosyltransferase RgtA/B/C/D-like domain-containing protein n=1 Tax=Anaeromyxobacter paludicola TaxID=2918171 RepID=A0ABN6N8Y1_9BACT|nr:hypothetical protein [Anaeromyxobacter paludicola]BDG09516.1 hypothetical protein AMPC_26290 [Anaeromyxobacter paludicola]
MLALLWIFPALAAAAAAALVARLDRAGRWVILGFAALFAASALLSPEAYVHDHLTHFRHARAVLDDPRLLLHTWDRPAFLLLYAAPARLGLRAARLFSLVPAAVAMAATMLAARRLGLARPWLAGVFLATQLDFFGQASSTMTELLFAAGFGVALLGLAEDAPALAAAGLGLVGISRPEGPLFVALGAALLVQRRRLAAAAGAFLPFAAYLAAGALAYGDLLWFVHLNAYQGGNVAPRLELRQLWRSYFYTAAAETQPAVLLALELVALAALARRDAARPRWLAWALAPLAVEWLLLTFLRIGPADWWRQSRYLVSFGPALALLACEGLARLERWLPAAAPRLAVALAGASAAATLLDRRRLPGVHGPALAGAVLLAVLALTAVLVLAHRRVPPLAALTGLLVLPLALAPPGAFARHRPIPGERLDLAAARWLVARRPPPPVVGFDSPALEPACAAELADPCPLPLGPVRLDDAPPGALFVKQFAEGAPAEPPPPGWREVWTGVDGRVRGPQLSPRWVETRATIWERVGPGTQAAR